MPYVGDDVHAARKRRRDDDENEVYRLYGSPIPQELYMLNQTQDVPSRKIWSLAKRARITDDEQRVHGDFIPTHRRRSSQHRGLLHDSPTYGVKVNIKPPATTLSPCHICHRRPTKKSDLDSFAECQGCGERTCFICIRDCQRWDTDVEASILSEKEVLSRSFHMEDATPVGEAYQGRLDTARRVSDEDPGHRNRKGWDAGSHRNMVCSRCCVERGAQGEVICLGCLSALGST